MVLWSGSPFRKKEVFENSTVVLTLLLGDQTVLVFSFFFQISCEILCLGAYSGPTHCLGPRVPIFARPYSSLQTAMRLVQAMRPVLAMLGIVVALPAAGATFVGFKVTSATPSMTEAVRYVSLQRAHCPATIATAVVGCARWGGLSQRLPQRARDAQTKALTDGSLSALHRV